MNSAIDIYLELDALKKMFVRFACHMGLADFFFCCWQGFFQNILKVNSSFYQQLAFCGKQLSFRNDRHCVNVNKNISSLKPLTSTINIHRLIQI